MPLLIVKATTSCQLQLDFAMFANIELFTHPRPRAIFLFTRTRPRSFCSGLTLTLKLTLHHRGFGYAGIVLEKGVM